MRLGITNARLITMGSDGVLENACLCTQDDRIVFIGDEGKLPEDDSFYDEVIDVQGDIVMPGFVNAHGHLAMSLLRGYGSDLPLKKWLEQMIWPAEDRLQKGDVFWGSLLGLMEMIRAGTTCFADMYFFMDETAQAVQQAGIRANLCRGITFPCEGDGKIEQGMALYRQWHGGADGRIRVTMGPHAEYTNTVDSLSQIRDAAEKLGCGIQIHVSETQDEVLQCRQRYGVSPVELLSRLGIFKLPTIAAHCVDLSDQDIQILADQGVWVAHNPTSNMKLASGFMRLPEILRAGGKVCLGTDGASSNNNLDLWKEAAMAALIHKAAWKSATAVPSCCALEMATTNGAKALGFDAVGQLIPGAKADFIRIDTRGPQYQPWAQAADQVIYAGRSADVRMTVCDGKILYRDGEYTTLDAERIYHEVSAIYPRLHHS